MNLLARLTLSTTLVLLSASRAEAATWFVRADAAPGGDGTSWASAFDTVQAGIAAANAGDQVWVNTGTYRPGTSASPRTATFSMKSGVRVYGGFAGDETALEQRDWIANPTVLSGDLQQDDTPGFGNRADNVYHVVRAHGVASSSSLDGFTVRGGNANGVDEGFGGGILGANATLRNLTVTDNEAFAGGGIGLPEAVAWNPTPIRGVTVRGNRAVSGGGGIVCTASGLVLRECVVAGNRADFGGGLYIYLDSQGPASVESCLVVGNESTEYGGGIATQWCALTVRNTVIAHNHGGPSTGGMIGGGQPFAAVTFANSIAWGNTSDAAIGPYLAQLSTAVVVSQSAVQGAAGPLDLDPRWIRPLGEDGVAGTADDDFTLSCTSPYIDRGDNALSVGLTVDLAGNPRFADDPATPDLGIGTAPIVDLGPYEFTCECDEVASYCTSLPNSSGQPASISAAGSTSLFANALVLHAVDGPPLKNGIFFYGAARTSVPWGDGIRCVGGSLYRLPLVTLDANGAVAFPLDVTQHPASGGPGAILEGSTWNFQLYFRDPTGGPAGWNTTDAIAVAFCR